MIVFAETGMGACLRKVPYRNLQRAAMAIEREVGTRNGVQCIREATQADIDWVKGMGGAIVNI